MANETRLTAASEVSVVSFAAFYIGARRARVAIAARLLLTFLVMLQFALTIPEVGQTPGSTSSNAAQSERVK